MSNLLKDASILLTPTAYENGRMNAIKPYKDLYGSELVTNGDFSNGSTDWTISGSASVGVNKLNVNAGAFDFFATQTALTNGLKYKVTLDAEVTSGDILLYTGTQFASINSSGSYTFYTTSDSAQIRFRSSGSGFVGSITNVSVKEDLSGDFQFSRNSAATRVNAQGLVENVQIISDELVSNGNFSQIGTEEVSNGNFSQEGSELITNGDFATDTNWTLSSGITYNSDGYIDFDGTQGAGQARNTPNITFVQGKTYKVVYEIKNYVSGNIKFRFQTGTNTIGQQVNGDGVKTEYIVCNDSLNNNFQFFNSPGFTGSIDNVSVKEVGQDWDFGTGWSMGDGKAVSVPSGGGVGIAQGISFTSGKTYKVEYTIQDYVQGNVRPSFSGGGTVTGTTNSANGTHIHYLTATVNHTTFNIKSTGTNGGFDGSITNISVKEVGQDWTFGTGWSVDQANSRAEAIDAPFGSQLIDGTTLVASKKYKISFDISNYIQGSVRIAVGNVFSSDVSADGSYTFILTSANTNAFKVQSRGGGSGTTLSVTNISVKEITDDTDLPRINYEGFSYQDSLGSELVVNGDFSDGTNGWSAGGGASISVSNNQLIIEADNDFNFYARQSVGGFEVGKQYKVEIDVAGGTTSKMQVSLYGEGLFFDNQPIVLGKLSAIVTVTNGVDGIRFLDIYNRNDDGLNDTLIINNVSVKEYLGQEVVPDSGCGSWLLEGQSTNLVTYSSDYSPWVWGGDSNANNTTRVDGYLSPDGEQNAALFTRNAGTGGWFSSANLSVTLNQTYTYSLFVKKGTSSTIELLNVSNTPQSKVIYNIDTNTFTTEQNATGSFVDYGNGWYRIAMTFEHLSTTVTSAQIRHILEDGESMYVFGSQFENQSYATSYIPTNGATNTRLRDIANNSGNSTLINSTEGVLYGEIAALADDGTTRRLSLVGSSSADRINISYTSIGDRVQCFAFVGGVLQFNFTPTLSDVTQSNKIAVKYKENDFALWVNGTEVATDTSGICWAENTLNTLTFSNNPQLYDEPFHGKTKTLAVYKEALTDANLRCLTYPNPVATTFDLDFDTIAEQFTFTRGSEATFVNAQGLIESTASNDAPRIDYSTGEKAFLLEPQSTNITPYSEDFTQSWTPTGLTITSNSIASPSGEINSDKWVEDTSNGAHNIRNNPNLSVTSGNNYTMSIFAKAGERTGLRFANAAESGVEGRFDLSNGTVTLAGTNTTFVGIEDYGNGWYRCIISFTASTTIAQLNLRLMDGSSLSYQGDGTSGLYAWGAQLEQQSYATSYIPTDGASATRNQELCVDATPVINSEEGTLYAEISALADNTTNQRISLSYDNQNFVRIAVNNSEIVFAVYNNGAYQVNTNYVVSNITDFNKVAVKYKENDFALWVNGTEVRTDTSGLTSFATPLDHLNFSNANSGGSFFYGKTKGLKYYPKALADVQLEDLTTI